MKFNMKQIREIIDPHEDLIGKDNVPQHGGDIENRANGTTDYNSKIGHQPFRYDMLGRFGFTMLPFYEGEENQTQLELLSDLSNLMDEYYDEVLSYYAKNPNKLKSDYRRKLVDNLDVENVLNDKYSREIIQIVQKHFENAFDEPENIDETSVVEDKVVKEKGKGDITSKDDNNEISQKKLEKIAGLINKLDKDDVKKIKGLLETE
ncbi:MAG: hypothetical protein ACOC2W_04690 [bacterium]